MIGCAQVETANFVDGWNTIVVPDWEMSGNFIIACIHLQALLVLT